MMIEGKVVVLVFADYYLPGYKAGGPIKTLKNLFEQAGDGLSFKLITSDRDFGDKSSYTAVVCDAWNKVGKVEVFYMQPGAVAI